MTETEKIETAAALTSALFANEIAATLITCTHQLYELNNMIAAIGSMINEINEARVK